MPLDTSLILSLSKDAGGMVRQAHHERQLKPDDKFTINGGWKQKASHH